MINLGLFAVMLAGVLFMLFFFGVVWFVIAALNGMFGGAARACNAWRSARGRARRGGMDDTERNAGGRVCPRSACAKINVSRARFCAQCGQRL